jgi:translocation and assembly module TamA
MRLAPLASALGLAASLLLAACAKDTGPERLLGTDDGGALPSPPPVPYEVRFPGDLPPDLATLLPQVSESERGREQPPSSRLGVRQRAERDVGLLQQALRAEGYFDATVGFRLEDPASVPAQGVVQEVERVAARPQVVLVFEIAPGPRYRFGTLAVELADNPDTYPTPSLKSLGLVEGEPARTQAVLDAETSMLRAVRRAGFALARLGQREAIVDHDTQRMDVTLRLEPDRRAAFGKVTFTGDAGVEESFLRGRVPFASGQRYDPALLDEGQRNLFDTNLFSTIIIRPAEQLTADGRLDVAYELRERPPRSIGASLNYQTDQGFGTTLFWEHRNYFGAGELLRAEIGVSQVEQVARLRFRKPDFLRVDQNLLADAAVDRQDSDAYLSSSVGAGVAIERIFTRQLKGSLGVAYRFAEIEDKSGDQPDELFGLLSLPATVSWDFSNDRFDPTRGGAVILTTTPFTDLLGPSRSFLKSRLTHTRYFEIARAPQLVLALRGSVGSIVGNASRDEVPADERFYAGGGGSIRGIAFQLAGPLDDDDRPLGGRSLVEGSIELRSRLQNNLGAVLFLDGGTVYDTSLPWQGSDLLFGAGPGLRYFTPIGPVRVDLGFPLNPRQGVDDNFQLYVSIGQAF